MNDDAGVGSGSGAMDEDDDVAVDEGDALMDDDGDGDHKKAVPRSKYRVKFANLEACDEKAMHSRSAVVSDAHAALEFSQVKDWCTELGLPVEARDWVTDETVASQKRDGKQLKASMANSSAQQAFAYAAGDHVGLLAAAYRHACALADRIQTLFDFQHTCAGIAASQHELLTQRKELMEPIVSAAAVHQRFVSDIQTAHLNVASQIAHLENSVAESSKRVADGVANLKFKRAASAVASKLQAILRKQRQDSIDGGARGSRNQSDGGGVSESKGDDDDMDDFDNSDADANGVEMMDDNDDAATTIVQADGTSAPAKACAASAGSADVAAVDDGSLMCTICYDEFSAEGQICILPCGHMLHGECMKSWVCSSNGNARELTPRMRVKCPNCNGTSQVSDVYGVDSRSSGREVDMVTLPRFANGDAAMHGAGAGAGAGSGSSASSSSASSSSAAVAALPSSVVPCSVANRVGLTGVESSSYGGKISTLIRRLKALPANEKAIVATTWTRVLDIAKAAFEKENVPAVILTGAPTQRAAAIDRFKSAPASEARVLLLSIGTDCSGLTLTAANHLFVLDPVLSPAVMGQLTGRICRQGQTRPCVVYHMAVQGSVEEGMIKLRHRKATAGSADDTAHSAALRGGEKAGDANAASADTLSPQDLLELLDDGHGHDDDEEEDAGNAGDGHEPPAADAAARYGGAGGGAGAGARPTRMEF